MFRRLLSMALLVGQAAPAAAQCDEMGGGSIVTERCEADGLRHWVVRADLAAGDVGLRVGRSMDRGETVEAWASSVAGARVIVQGGDFEFPSYVPRGLTVGEGEAWPDSADDGRYSVLAFDDRNVGIVVPPQQVVPYEDWMAQALGGPLVLQAGVPVSCVDACPRTSRTGVGLSEDGRVLVVVVAEGDRAESVGVTLEELGTLLRDAGAHDAIASGEGATSTLWREGAVASPSSDGASRPAAAHLAVIDRASGESTKIQGVVGIEGMPDEHLPESMLVVERTDGRMVASGSPVTEGAYWEFTVPIGEYIVRAAHPGYRRGCKVCAAPIGEEVWCSIFLSVGEGEETCVAPARTLEVGPWPEAGDDAGPSGDAGVDAGAGGGGGCSSAGGAELSCAWVVLLGWRRRA